ncbi:hypothetical protein ACFYUY_39615 [Kitasatospora sp. NPDC004745]|uniref:hypothetical protein n=1 Tax=Kitasatospora sp. NPDC004745 TaxID=3364019 RepID=UPI00368BFD32
MLESPLTPDVPLGPFQDAPITVHSARSKSAKLHAGTTCTQLRSRDITTTQAPLNAETIGRMCSRCAEFGQWVPPDSGLGIFLRALGGLGLLYQLQQYTAPDPDDCWEQDEVQSAAALLRTGPVEPAAAPDEDEEAEEPDGEDWEAHDDAKRLQERVLSTWREAATSLHLAQTAIAMFPWLARWADPKLASKQQYLEALRTQAALFVDLEGLMAAAAAAAMDEPELPSNDAAFSVIGTSKEAGTRLKALWHAWQDKAGRGWEGPNARTYLAYGPTHGIRPNRKGYVTARVAIDELVSSWENQAREEAASAECQALQWVTASLPIVKKDTTPPWREHGFLSDLDTWTTGVLIAHLADADWAGRTLILHVPRLIADRLLSRSHYLDCEAHQDRPAPTTPVASAGPIRPGIFDDTPVHGRQPLTAQHLRLLRSMRPAAADELYIVFSTDGGAEVLPLPVIEKRLARGWQCFLLAGASDLPADVIEPWVREVGPRPEGRESLWPQYPRNAHDPLFGEDLGLAQGATRAAWLGYEHENAERSLRLLAMARGVEDLRTLDGGYDDHGRSRSLPRPVWLGLLAHAEDLDLEPFEAPDADRWRSGGSGIPLGVLADVQVYTTNANPRIQGKGHSPFCPHSRERGVVAADDLLTVADLLDDDSYDWCSKCQGYAIRRLTDTQLSYYRAAHRLHDIAQELDPGRGGHDRLDTETITRQLRELADWRPIGEDHWYTSGARRWRRIVHELHAKAEAAGRDTP